jgi:hypothetical protein
MSSAHVWHPTPMPATTRSSFSSLTTRMAAHLPPESLTIRRCGCANASPPRAAFLYYALSFTTAHSQHRGTAAMARWRRMAVLAVTLAVMVARVSGQFPGVDDRSRMTTTVVQLVCSAWVGGQSFNDLRVTIVPVHASTDLCRREKRHGCHWQAFRSIGSPRRRRHVERPPSHGCAVGDTGAMASPPQLGERTIVQCLWLDGLI